eukprot:3941359-Rhodomonas_salina.2
MLHGCCISLQLLAAACSFERQSVPGTFDLRIARSSTAQPLGSDLLPPDTNPPLNPFTSSRGLASSHPSPPREVRLHHVRLHVRATELRKHRQPLDDTRRRGPGSVSEEEAHGAQEAHLERRKRKSRESFNTSTARSEQLKPSVHVLARRTGGDWLPAKDTKTWCGTHETRPESVWASRVRQGRPRRAVGCGGRV